MTVRTSLPPQWVRAMSTLLELKSSYLFQAATSDNFTSTWWCELGRFSLFPAFPSGSNSFLQREKGVGWIYHAHEVLLQAALCLTSACSEGDRWTFWLPCWEHFVLIMMLSINHCYDLGVYILGTYSSARTSVLWFQLPIRTAVPSENLKRQSLLPFLISFCKFNSSYYVHWQ